jgi:hypothetical protein
MIYRYIKVAAEYVMRIGESESREDIDDR